MGVRCKFSVWSIEPQYEGDTGRLVDMQTSYCPEVPEDQAFCKATPSGSLQFRCDNPAALAQLEVGKSYYLDITPAA